jgi:molybdate transport system substrate-binding protein
VSRRLGLALACLVVGSAACSPSPSGSGDDARTVLTVFAASSLTDPFGKIGDAFSDEHENVQVAFSFAGSSDLVAQIRSGAPADVLATADEVTMSKAGDALASAPRLFATNTLTIAVPAGNPAGVEGLEDLGDDALDVVVCAPQVPCGAAAATVATRAGVNIRPVSEESNVVDVLSKVASGEADAGLVYVTDIASADGDVDAVDIPAARTAVNRYPMAVVEGSERAELARDFVDFVLGARGQAILRESGFGEP